MPCLSTRMNTKKSRQDNACLVSTHDQRTKRGPEMKFLPALPKHSGCSVKCLTKRVKHLVKRPKWMVRDRKCFLILFKSRVPPGDISSLSRSGFVPIPSAIVHTRLFPDIKGIASTSDTPLKICLHIHPYPFTSNFPNDVLLGSRLHGFSLRQRRTRR